MTVKTYTPNGRHSGRSSGRPPSLGTPRECQITARTTRQEYARFVAFAKGCGQSLSQAAREVLIAAVGLGL